jgi:hypothetical protein
MRFAVSFFLSSALILTSFANALAAIDTNPSANATDNATVNPAQDPAQNQIPTSTTPAIMTLFGGVSHSDALQHVKNALDKHRKSVKPLSGSAAAQTDSANTAALQAAANQSQGTYLPMNGVAQTTSDETKPLKAEVQKYMLEWFMIPKWLAGKWEKSGDLTVSITDLQTGQQTFPNSWTENEQENLWGHQADAAGNVWHVNFLPSEKDGRSDDKVVRFLVTSQKCEKTDDQQLITRTQYVVSESSFLTGEATNMFQQESLNHYMLQPDQYVVNNSTNRVFTYSGQAVRDGQLQTKFTKTAEFVPTPALNGYDLHQALNDYLEAHGLANLMSKP